MKKFILIISIFVINCNLVNAQGCLPNGITITSQEQIDNFQSSYPDCTIIEGNLIIGDAYNGTDVSNLIGLEHIVAIEGNLEIFGNDELINLNGLENLTLIGGDLKIGIFFDSNFGCIDTVHYWHFNIEKNKIGGAGADKIKKLLAIRRFANYFNIFQLIQYHF